MIGMPFFAKNRPRMIASGGTITAVGIEKVHTFTTSGTFTCLGRGYIQFLIVGAGGNGSAGYASGSTERWSGAGGRGGAVLYTTAKLINPASYTITVGVNDGTGNSNCFGYTASNAAHSSYYTVGAGTGAAGGAGINGGSGCNNGTNGTSNSITGTLYVYASGGGGGWSCWAVAGAVAGGSGGTGAGNGGGTSTVAAVTNPTGGTNYGSGGGGGSHIGNYGVESNGAGGKSGVVIIRYIPI